MLPALLLIAILGSAGGANVPPPRHADIKQAVFAEGRLWLLTDDGKLSSIRPGAHRRTVESAPSPAASLCIHQGALSLVSPAADAMGWIVHRRVGGTWKAGVAVPTQGDDLVAVDCGGAAITLLTDHRVLTLRPGEIDAVGLRGAPGLAMVTATLATDDAVLVGYNRGEWGGGMQRIDRRTGEVATIERNAGGDLCGGPLNTQCDPVNAIVADPWKPDCVVCAIGLVHFAPSGRLVEVCGRQVEKLYGKSLTAPGERPSALPHDDRFETVAFFGLAKSGDGLWAVGIDGLYHLRAPDRIDVKPLPKFENVNGVGVSFDEPGLVLVLTTINQHLSVGGAVPLLVPR